MIKTKALNALRGLVFISVFCVRLVSHAYGDAENLLDVENDVPEEQDSLFCQVCG